MLPQSAFISCDLALFIRLLEVAREELKGDEDLHKLVERISAQQVRKGEALDMSDYDAIMAQPTARQPLNAAARLRAAPDEEQLELTLKVKGNRECVERAAAALYLMYRNGAVGHSGIFGAYWDGDGADKIDLEGLPKELTKKFSELAEALSDYAGTAELVGENLTGFVLSNDSSGGHYCKHTKVFPKEE